MEIVEAIIEGYTRVADGMKRIDLTADDGSVIKTYRAGTIIRIDIKESFDEQETK